MSKHRAEVDPDAPVQTVVVEGLEQAVDAAPAVRTHVETGLVNVGDLEAVVGQILEQRLGHFLADIERRLGQTRELEASIANGGGKRRKVHAEDLDLLRHTIDGYTVTANSPGAGSIAWTSVHIMYGGVDYTIADGNTANRYVWFVKPGSYTPGTPVVLQNSNTKPTLSTGDTYVFINNSGTPTSVLEGNGSAPVLGGAIVDSASIIAGAVGTTALADDAVTNAKIGPAAVGTTEIGSGAVGTTQIADDAVSNAKIGPNAVNTTELANGAVGSTQIATGGVATGNLAAGAVDNTKLANGAVLPQKLNILQHVMF